MGLAQTVSKGVASNGRKLKQTFALVSSFLREAELMNNTT